MGFELRRQEQSRGLNVGAKRAPEQDCGSLVDLISELVFRSGLLRNGLEAASAPGFGAGGATRWSAFRQVTGERNIVDLLEVLLDFTPGVLQ